MYIYDESLDVIHRPTRPSNRLNQGVKKRVFFTGFVEVIFRGDNRLFESFGGRIDFDSLTTSGIEESLIEGKSLLERR